MAKRFFDLSLSVLLLILLFPLLVIIYYAIKCTSDGPVIFKQQRMAYLGIPFTILKFRTLKDGTGKDVDRILEGDPRITRVGKLLRSTHLDELPQLWNVVCGEMSLVGPRPLLVGGANIRMKENALSSGIFKVRPGITGPVQICGRMWIIGSQDEAIKKDLAYINGRSLFSDLKIIFLTFSVVLKRQGI